MLKFVIGVNVLTEVDALVYGNHCKFWYRCAKDFPDSEFNLIAPRRMSIDRMRNETAKYALQNNADYIVFLDDDVLIESNALLQLYQTMQDKKAAIVAGLTYIRSYPFEPMVFVGKANKNPFEKYLSIPKNLIPFTNPEGLIYCDAVGFSFVLIDTKYFKELTPPFFVTGSANTEDVYFCLKVKDYFSDALIICDVKVQTGHLGDKIVVHERTVEKLRDVEQSYYDEGVLTKSARSVETIEKRIAALVTPT